HRLFEADVWESPRTSDGIPHLRIVESAPERMRLCGRIYTIDQVLHSFWLDLEREPDGSAVSWALFFDVVADSPRRERDAIDVHDQASDIDWRVTLTGQGELRDGTLVVIRARNDSMGKDAPKQFKPCDKLTVQDLADFPLWGFDLSLEGVSGADETWV